MLGSISVGISLLADSVHRSIFLLRLPRFIRVLSKMEQLLELFQNGRFKMMDGSGSLFNNT